ncbi:MAG: LytR C-terminal domain-containing protein [Candidatus Dojkabacteria bacterium]
MAKETGKQKKLNLIWQLLSLLLVGLLIYSSFGIYSMLHLRSQGFSYDLDEELEWEGQSNLTVFLLGVDDTTDELRFVDSIHLLHFRADSGSIQVLTISPELNILVEREDTFNLEDENKYLPLRNLINYFRQQKVLGAEIDPFNEFVFELEALLGVRSQRHIVLSKQDLPEILIPFQRARGIEQNSQEFISRLSKENEQDPDEKLLAQNDALVQIFSAMNSPFWYALSIPSYMQNRSQLDRFVETDLSGAELWRLISYIRNTAERDVRLEIVSQDMTFIQGERLFLDRNDVDELLREILRNNTILQEQARIDLLNGGDQRGQAANTRRILENHSFDVVRIESTIQPYTTPTLYLADPKAYPNTIETLQNFFPNLEIKQEEYPFRPTGDMVLVVV